MASVRGIRQQTFTSKTLRSGWRKTGLDPISVERSLNFLRHEYSVHDIDAFDELTKRSRQQLNAVEELKYKLLLRHNGKELHRRYHC